MKNIFNPDSPVMDTLAKMGNFLLLNVFWLVGCIPLITIGASTTALYRCMIVYKRDGDVKAIREFWKTFAKEFRQATLLLLVLTLVVGLLVVDLYIIAFSQLVTEVSLWILMGLLLLLTLPAMNYVFPLQAYYQNTTRAVLKNAWLMAFANLPTSVLVTIVNWTPLLVALALPEFFTRSALVWLLLGGSVCAYINTGLLMKVFSKYTNESQ